MENKSIIEKIQKNFGRMSSGHKQIARYFLENDTDASYATTTQIAEALQLSESTVVRFAKTLGYSGFPALRHELQESVKERISSAQRIIKTIGGTSDLSNLLEKSIFTDIALLKDTIKEISRENFQKAVETISNSKRIFVLGLRSSESLALFLAFRLKRFNFDARQIIISGDDALGQQLAFMRKEDLLITVGFFETPWQTMAALKYANEKGIRTMVITHSQVSPLAQLADIILIAKRGQRGTVNSITAPISVINALSVALAKVHKKRIVKAMDQLDSLLNFIKNQARS